MKSANKRVPRSVQHRLSRRAPEETRRQKCEKRERFDRLSDHVARAVLFRKFVGALGRTNTESEARMTSARSIGSREILLRHFVRERTDSVISDLAETREFRVSRSYSAYIE